MSHNQQRLLISQAHLDGGVLDGRAILADGRNEKENTTLPDMLPASSSRNTNVPKRHRGSSATSTSRDYQNIQIASPTRSTYAVSEAEVIIRLLFVIQTNNDIVVLPASTCNSIICTHVANLQCRALSGTIVTCHEQHGRILNTPRSSILHPNYNQHDVCRPNGTHNPSLRLGTLHDPLKLCQPSDISHLHGRQHALGTSSYARS